MGTALITSVRAGPVERPVEVGRNHDEGEPVKVKPSVKKICNKCRIIRRHGRVMVICSDPRHKQRQG